MRVTNNMLIGNMIRYMGNNLIRMDKFQNQLATGKKISVPSDDPIVAARALKLRTDVAEVNQFQSNVQDAQSWMDITESTLSQIGDVFQRARELAVQSSSGTNGVDDNQKTAEEIKQLKGHLIQLGNTSYAGRYVFSGFKTDQRLLNDDGSFNLDVMSTENINFEVGISDAININVVGGNLYNNGTDSTAGTTGQMIQDMDDFITSLTTGTSEQVSNSISRIDAQINNLLTIRADVGARYKRLELTSNRLDEDRLNFTKLMSSNEDVDMAETIMNLKNEENVYRASLSGGARVIQPTLIDFLR